MPKDTKEIEFFHGGLSNHSDAMDIEDNELAESVDIMVDTVGKIRTIGSASAITSPDWHSILFGISNGVHTPGYGLYTFGMDQSLSGATGIKRFMALAGIYSGGAAVAIYQADGTHVTNLSLQSSCPGDFKPVFYFANGVLRMCDSNFDHTTSVNKGFGYINKTQFSGLNVERTLSGHQNWEINQVLNTSHLYGDRYIEEGVKEIPFPSNNNIAINMKFSGTSGTWSNTLTYSIYIAYLYFDDMIGNAVLAESISPSSGSNSLQLRFGFRGNYPENVKGLKVYYRKSDDTAQNLYLLGTLYFYADDVHSVGFYNDKDVLYTSGGYEDINGFYFTRQSAIPPFLINYYIGDSSNFAGASTAVSQVVGIRAGSGTYKRIYAIDVKNRVNWNTGDYLYYSSVPYDPSANAAGMTVENLVNINGLYTTYPNWAQNLVIFDPPTEITYTYETGRTLTDTILPVKYKTATINKNVAYIGNVLIGGQRFEDSIFKSEPNQYDNFPLKNRIEAVGGDGEAVVKVESHADRILEFKEYTLRILNVSQDIEFIESTHQYKGISYPYLSCQTEYGIAWVNSKGCYLYDGNQIHDLLLRQDGSRKISLSYWTSFLSSTPSITYDANNKIIMVFSNVSGTDIDIMIYDVVTGSWNYGKSKYAGTSSNYTNPVTDWNGDIIIHKVNGANLYKWDNDSANTSTSFRIVSKDYDFGYPGLKKTVYRVYVTFKGRVVYTSYPNVRVRYRINGDKGSYHHFIDAANDQYVTVVGGYAELSGVADLNQWGLAQLKPATQSLASNIRSFQLVFTSNGNAVDSSFEINNIIIVSRLIGKR